MQIGKTTWWATNRKSVLFRCGPKVCVKSVVKAVFDQSGLRWLPFTARSGEVDPAIADDSVEALFIVGLDRAPRKVRQFVSNLIGERPKSRIVWATVTVSEDDFDLDMADPTTTDGFDIVVDVRTVTG